MNGTLGSFCHTDERNFINYVSFCLRCNCYFVTMLTRWYATPFYCTINFFHMELAAPQRQTLELLVKKMTTPKRAARHDDFCICQWFCYNNYLKMKVRSRHVLFIDLFVYFVFQFAIRRYKGEDIQNHNFACCFVWMRNVVADIERGT